jgi:hypothetical protein
MNRTLPSLVSAAQKISLRSRAKKTGDGTNRGSEDQPRGNGYLARETVERAGSAAVTSEIRHLERVGAGRHACRAEGLGQVGPGDAGIQNLLTFLSDPSFIGCSSSPSAPILEWHDLNAGSIRRLCKSWPSNCERCGGNPRLGRSNAS